MQGELNNEQIAAMLIALKVRGATIDELNWCGIGILAKCQIIPSS